MLSRRHAVSLAPFLLTAAKGQPGAQLADGRQPDGKTY